MGWGFLAFPCAFGIYWMPPQLRGGQTVSVKWNAVPRGNDAAAYLDLAVQIAKGRGLSENGDDPTLRSLTSGRSSGDETDPDPAIPSTN